MSESKKLIPRRRFHSFIYSDDWSLTRLENLGNFNPSSILPNQFEYVDLESVIGNQMVSHRTVDRKQAPSRAQRLAKKGDIFYQTVRPYQQNNYFFNLLEENYVFSTGYAQIRPFGDGYFLFTKLQERKFLLEVLDNCIGTSFPAINSTALAKIRVFTPLNIEEQYNIGNFFQKLDNLINTQQKKLEKAKTLKSAYLTEMFPNEGELKPKLRFTGFNISWKEKKLEEITKTTIGEFVIKTKQNPNSPYPVYNGGISYTGFYDEFNNEANKIVISARGANAGFINIVRNRYWAGNSCYSINIINNTLLSIDYLFYSLKRNQHFFTQNQQAANIPSVSKKEVETFTVLLTNITEQTKIGNLFKLLDNKIALEQKKLDKLKNIKQAYLNEMFV